MKTPVFPKFPTPQEERAERLAFYDRLLEEGKKDRMVIVRLWQDAGIIDENEQLTPPYRSESDES